MRGTNYAVNPNFNSSLKRGSRMQLATGNSVDHDLQTSQTSQKLYFQSATDLRLGAQGYSSASPSELTSEGMDTYMAHLQQSSTMNADLT